MMKSSKNGLLWLLILVISFVVFTCVNQDDKKKPVVVSQKKSPEITELTDVELDLDVPPPPPPPPVVHHHESGFSPYNSYFGKGKYNKSANNTIIVNSPKNSCIVFLLRDVKTGRTIRNEFINENSTFRLTSIPYGTYDFSYFSGQDWNDDVSLNDGQIKGGFTRNKSFSKSERFSDRMEFLKGYYGEYTLTLTEVLGGNLETEDIDEEDFFN